MAFAVPFGKYLPDKTPIHACDARTKLLIVAAYTFALFASNSWWAMAVLGLGMWLAYFIAHVPFKVALRGLKPLAVILVFTVAANAFTLQATTLQDAVVIGGNFGYTLSGLLAGLYFVLRICLLVLATSLITFTTTMVSLVDALTLLMSPLRRLHVPVDDLATMFSIALRFIPVTAEEADKVMMAQRARGVRFDVGGPITRLRKWAVVLIPLFVGLFRRADELACAMEARCYTGLRPVRLNRALMRLSDWVALIVLCALCIAVGILL